MESGSRRQSPQPFSEEKQSSSVNNYQSNLKQAAYEFLGPTIQQEFNNLKKVSNGNSQNKSFGNEDYFADSGNGKISSVNLNLNMSQIRKPKFEPSVSNYQKEQSPYQNSPNDNFDAQQSSYRDSSVDRATQRANLISSNNRNDFPYQQSNPQGSSIQAYKQKAHQLGSHGAAILKNHVGYQNMVIPDIQQKIAASVKASLSGGIAIPMSNASSFQSKKIFQDTNIFSSPQIEKGKLGKLGEQQSSLLANIQPVSIDKQQQQDKSQQSGQGSSIYSQTGNSSLQSQLVNQQNFALTMPAQYLNGSQQTQGQQIERMPRLNQDRQTFAVQELDSFLRDDHMDLNGRRQYQ